MSRTALGLVLFVSKAARVHIRWLTILKDGYADAARCGLVELTLDGAYEPQCVLCERNQESPAFS